MESRGNTRFERARLIGSRALQISMGAKPLVDFTPDMDPIKIAINEYEEGVLPLDAVVKDEYKD
ncbi:DNA-directed RNA polymerase subunit K [Candidatus Methanosphaera massiliense]|uniref:DNA-directed RNA polymerase subunit K n=1 Tax=Methanosphaera TaxID=2316 RepID=UPI000DC3AF89|nr:DNA-directed RNA polymerase subunit K [Candidatus Methanosphaera massiliense]MDD6286703.1 DNA-directed RNA polymerase subunit K [Methanobacteriaceae archaeon]MDE4078508.1 DNA-directed RNA polymerase subunit K [Candidatus Methanosphaera massiliense]MDY2745062.1 DNA-directed RNA polymerase subunit K [Methanosphaera sp.]RAP45585.1 MAG: DNA-directed RNA polymerase subunit K [Methanosphaera sp. SHI1033]